MPLLTDLLDDAAKLLISERDGISLTGGSQQPLAGRKALLDANRPALETLRAALAAPPSGKRGSRPLHLVRLLAFAADLLADSGDPSGAAQHATDGLALAIELQRGGTYLSVLSGIAHERLAATALLRVAARLDAPTCRSVALRIEAADARREAWSRTLDAEAEKALTPEGRRWYRDEAKRVAAPPKRRRPRSPAPEEVSPSILSGEATVRRQQTEIVLLRLALALRAFRQDAGDYPATLAPLVGRGYQKAIPPDPFSPDGAPLRYRRVRPDAYTLASVARDRDGRPLAAPSIP